MDIQDLLRRAAGNKYMEYRHGHFRCGTKRGQPEFRGHSWEYLRGCGRRDRRHRNETGGAFHRGAVRAVVPVPFRGAHHERPFHLYHAGHIRPHDRNIPDDFRRSDPSCHADKPGLGLHRAELSEIPVCPRFPGVFNHGLRGYLRCAGADDLHHKRYLRGDMDLYGIHGAAVFRAL